MSNNCTMGLILVDANEEIIFSNKMAENIIDYYNINSLKIKELLKKLAQTYI